MCLELFAEQEEIVHAAVGPRSRLELTSPTTQAHSMQAILGDVDLLQGWQVEQKESPFRVNLHACVVAHIQPLQIGCSTQRRWNPAIIETDEQRISATRAVGADSSSKYPSCNFLMVTNIDCRPGEARGGVSRHTRCCREPTEQGRATNRSHGTIKQLLTCGSHSVTGPNLSDWLSKAQLEERPGHHLQLHPAASACCKISLPLAVSANKSSESGFTALSAWTRRQTATTSCNSEQKALHTQHGHSCT